MEVYMSQSPELVNCPLAKAHNKPQCSLLVVLNTLTCTFCLLFARTHLPYEPCSVLLVASHTCALYV